MTARFLRIFSIVKEGGSYDSALVSYKKTEWASDYCLECHKRVIISYAHWLRINLWFVIVEHGWMSDAHITCLD